MLGIAQILHHMVIIINGEITMDLFHANKVLLHLVHNLHDDKLIQVYKYHMLSGVKMCHLGLLMDNLFIRMKTGWDELLLMITYGDEHEIQLMKIEMEQWQIDNDHVQIDTTCQV